LLWIVSIWVEEGYSRYFSTSVGKQPPENDRLTEVQTGAIFWKAGRFRCRLTAEYDGLPEPCLYPPCPSLQYCVLSSEYWHGKNPQQKVEQEVKTVGIGFPGISDQLSGAAAGGLAARSCEPQGLSAGRTVLSDAKPTGMRSNKTAPQEAE
jgi:hypothetical protein